MDLHVDLGQIIISAVIVTIGYFIKNEINTFRKRLDRHDQMLISLVGDVQRLIGIVGTKDDWNGYNRRES